MNITDKEHTTGSGAGTATKLGRRRLLAYVGAALAAALLGKFGVNMMAGKPLLMPAALGQSTRRNFRAVYQDPKQREQFYLFLRNIFHLYPEDDFHSLIERTVNDRTSDPAVYYALMGRIQELDPFLSSLRYALPALRKQKVEMARQTTTLLRHRKNHEGYLEIGSHGRYLSALRSGTQIEGPIYTSTLRPPTYSPVDILDREQFSPVGHHVPMNDYGPIASRQLPAASLQLVTIYIGLHHCPLAAREPYVESIRDAMAPEATLILRDHDVTNTQMDHFVGLAHDVFNLGTRESWDTNARELRHFYGLSFISEYLEKHGFRDTGARLVQEGDPTHNTLMAFRKV